MVDLLISFLFVPGLKDVGQQIGSKLRIKRQEKFLTRREKEKEKSFTRRERERDLVIFSWFSIRYHTGLRLRSQVMEQVLIYLNTLSLV